jgi:hypothetical protein
MGRKNSSSQEFCRVRNELTLEIQKRTKKVHWISPFQRIKDQRRNTKSYLKHNETRNIGRPTTKFELMLNEDSQLVNDILNHRNKSQKMQEYSNFAFELFKRE